MNLPMTRKNQFITSQTISRLRPGMAFGVIIVIALLAFEIFNYSTTDYALRDLLGDLKFAGIPWSTVLTIAFCAIDFAGIARLFTPQRGSDEPKEVWYLFGAWMLAATMNATLTWWGVAMAISNHTIRSTEVMDATTIMRAVPVFVAIMVWIIRILIIGSLSVAGEKLLWGENAPKKETRSSNTAPAVSSIPMMAHAPTTPRMTAPRPQPTRRAPAPDEPVARPDAAFHPEPTYHSLGVKPRPSGASETKRL